MAERPGRPRRARARDIAVSHPGLEPERLRNGRQGDRADARVPGPHAALQEHRGRAGRAGGRSRRRTSTWWETASTGPRWRPRSSDAGSAERVHGARLRLGRAQARAARAGVGERDRVHRPRAGACRSPRPGRAGPRARRWRWAGCTEAIEDGAQRPAGRATRRSSRPPSAGCSSDRELRERLGAGARERARGFSWDATVPRHARAARGGGTRTGATPTRSAGPSPARTPDAPPGWRPPRWPPT